MASELDDPLIPKNEETEQKPEVDIQIVRMRLARRWVSVEPVLLVYSLLVFPFGSLSTQYILQYYTEQLQGNQTHQHNDTSCVASNTSSPEYLLDKKIQEKTTYFTMWLNIASAVPAVVVSLFLGPYSDRAGRKRIMLAALAASVFNVCLFTAVVAFKLPLQLLFVGAFVQGSSGTIFGLVMSSMALLSDITTPETRAFRLTIAELCIFLPGSVSLFGVGFLIKHLGFLWPLVGILVGSSFNVLYVIFFVPETVQHAPDVKFFQMAHLQKIAQLFLRDSGSPRTRQLQLLTAATFFGELGIFGAFNFIVLFVSDFPLCWDSVKIGIIQSVIMLVAAFGGGVVVRPLTIFLSDMKVALLSGLLTSAASIYIGLVTTDTMMYITPVFFILLEIFLPTLRAVSSKLVSHAEHGAALSGVCAAEALAALVGQLLFNPIYVATNKFYHGFVYFVIAAFQLVSAAIVLAYVMSYGHPPRSSSEHRVDIPADQPQEEEPSTDAVS